MCDPDTVCFMTITISLCQPLHLGHSGEGEIVAIAWSLLYIKIVIHTYRNKTKTLKTMETELSH